MDVNDQLLSALDNLVDKELKKFQWYLLKGNALDGFPALLKSHLQNADRQDTVDKMVETYGESGALKISAEILRKLNRNDEALKLEPPVEKPSASPPPQPAAAPEASSLGGEQSDSPRERLRSARREFVKRVSKAVLNDLLDGLLEKKVLNDSETESVKVEKEKAEKARVLIDMVLMKGDRPCSMLMDLLREEDSFLHSELGFN